jgi:thiamine-phosphate pyrophosphorylase
VVFAPVFEKNDIPGATPTGLTALCQASREKIPVLALGGVTLENARACLKEGAAGIAGIRLFQQNEIGGVVQVLRALTTR